jgi:nitroreductase
MENINQYDHYQLSQLIRSRANSIDVATRTRNPDIVQKKSEMEELDLLLEEWTRRGLEEGQDIRWAMQKSQQFKAWMNNYQPLIIPYSGEPGAEDGKRIFELIRTRRSIRYWKKKKVPVELIHQIIEAGTWAPSAFNRLPWRFFVAETALRDMADGDAGNPGMFASAPVRLFVAVDDRLFFEKYSGPLDAGLAMQNMLLMAHASGLGACLVYQGEFVDPALLEKYYGIPMYCKVYCAILLGYPDENPEAPVRMNTGEITTYLGEVPNPQW